MGELNVNERIVLNSNSQKKEAWSEFDPFPQRLETKGIPSSENMERQNSDYALRQCRTHRRYSIP